MKNKIYNLIIIISALITLIALLLNKTLIFNTISYSLNMWVTSIIPSLFPFFVISDILISYNITNYIPNFIKKTFKYLFNTTEYIVTIFFLSIISGFPSNARNTRTLYDKGLISRDEARYCLMFTHFSNPLFILGTVSIFFLKSEIFGIIILISHYLSNILVGILFRNYHNTSDKKVLINNNCKTFSTVFTESIKKSIDSLLLILGTLTCFLIVSSLLISLFKLDDYKGTILKCILEITMGLKSLSLLNISDIYKVIISSVSISFGGLSVHMQVLSCLVGSDIPYKDFFIGRIYQAIISGIISFILYKVII